MKEAETPKISPDGKRMRVQLVSAQLPGSPPQKLRTVDGTIYIDNGMGPLLNPGRQQRKAQKELRRARSH